MNDSLLAPLDEFKPRELEILAMMARGLSNGDIADELFITKETVRWYNKQIYSKLGTSRRTEAIALAQKMGLIGTHGEAPPPQAAATTPPLAAPHLPEPVGPFIGRDDDIADLTDLLHQPDIRLVSIIAAGGMGKSRLSLELAHRIKSDYEHGVVFVDLTSVRSHEDIARTALTSLHLQPGGNQEPEAQLLDYCRRKHMLMIFDNMEHVLPGGAILARLLEHAPNVHIIATTRETLSLRVESAYYLAPVIKDAALLFTETAAMMHPGFEIASDAMPDVDRVVDLVGGMPLALILAATWVNVLSVAEIGDEIEQNLEFLSTDAADMPPRQRSIHAVLMPTWKRLNDQEKKAFMWASMFRGGFTRQAFQQVTGASIRVLQTLLGRSVIMPGYSRRYDMHPILRQFAREKLEASGEFDAARAAHLQTFLDFAAEQNHAMYNDSYLPTLEALETELDNFRAALDRALNGADVEGGAQLAVAVSNFHDIRSQSYEAEHYLSLAAGYALPDALMAPVLCWRCRFHDRLGDTGTAQQDAQAAITLAEAAGDQATLARAMNYISDLVPLSEQLSYIERSLAISEESGNTRLMAMSYNYLGTQYANNREYEKALAHYEQSQSLYEEVGDLLGVSRAVYNASLIYTNMKQHRRARTYVEQSLEIKKQIGDRAGMARRHAVLAYGLMLEEEFEEALALITESIALCEELGERGRMAYGMQVRGLLEFIATDFDRAQETFEASLLVANEVGWPPRHIELHQCLAMVHIIQNQIEAASAHAVEAVRLAREINLPYYTWISLLVYAPVLWASGERAAGLRLHAVVERYRHIASEVDEIYFLNPQVHRIQQQVGIEAWEAALKAGEDITLEDALALAVENIDSP